MPGKPWIPKYTRQLLDIVPLLISARNKFLKIKEDGSGIDAVDIDLSKESITGLKSSDSPTFAGLNVNGDMNISGVVNSVNSQNLNVKDTTITLNDGELGNGVSAGAAGIIVDRGLLPSTELAFDEVSDTWKIDSYKILTTASNTSDLADSADKRYITDAQKEVLQNTSGINTGDQDLSGLLPKSGGTITGQVTSTYSSPSTNPSVLISGTPYQAGDITGAKPLFLIEDNATPSTTWTNWGTYFGINAKHECYGNIIDIQKDGASKLSVSANDGYVRAANGLLTNTLWSSGIGSPLEVHSNRTWGSSATLVSMANSTYTNNSGQSSAVTIRPIYNQGAGATSSNTDFLINRTETVVGSGTQNLIDAQVGGVSKFRVDNTGRVFTQSYLVSVGNYSSNYYAQNDGNLLTLWGRVASGANGNAITLNNTNTFTNTTGNNNLVSITPTYNQVSSTAANTDLLINRTETSVGSGSQRFIEGQVAGVQKFYIASNGLGYFSGAVQSGSYLSGTSVITSTTNPGASGAIQYAGTIVNIGNQIITKIAPTYNQSSATSVANTDLLINRTETSLGTTPGAQLLIDAQVGGVSKFSVGNSGKVTVDTLYVTNGAGTITPSTNNSFLTLNQAAFSGTSDRQGLKLVTGTNTMTAGNFVATQITPVYNQAGSAAYNTDLLINRTETNIGSGYQYLFDAQVGGVSRFKIDNAGRTIINGSSSGNILTIQSTGVNKFIFDNSGTFTANSIWVNSTLYADAIQPNASGTVFIGSGNKNIPITAAQLASATWTNTYGTTGAVVIGPTYNQASGNASNTDLLISRTQTAVGSGAQLLIDAQVGGISKFKVDNTGKITATAISMAGGTLLAPMLQAYMEAVSVNTNVTTTQNIDCSASNICSCTLTGNTTFTISNPPMAGMSFSGTMYIIQGGSGSYTVTWPASFSWGDAGAPVLSTAVGKKDIVAFSTIDGGTTYQAFLAGTGF